MNINTLNSFNTDYIILDKPKKTDDVYTADVNFTFQTPKLEILKISKKLTLKLDENTEKLLNEFDNKIINLISKNSSIFFEEEISIDEADEIYKSSFKNSKINVVINKKVHVYNKFKENLDVESLSPNDIVICLLNCKKIIFYKNYCEPLWEVTQIKLKEIELDTKSYLFIEDADDIHFESDNIDDDLELNKIQIKN
tara:strand:+ start:6280 stop:6870 length:591 start_codon:yes stop_codon:yes gene_type:complete